MSVYDKVKAMLEENSVYRNSDRVLVWDYWMAEIGGRSVNGKKAMTINDYMHTTTPETITRARRKVQERHMHLRASKTVEEKRRFREMLKGMFVFHDR